MPLPTRNSPIVRIQDWYGRWWPVLNVFTSIIATFAVGLVAAIDLGSGNSIIFSLLYGKDAPSSPDRVVTILGVLITALAATLTWWYSDVKDRFVWRSMFELKLKGLLLEIFGELSFTKRLDVVQRSRMRQEFGNDLTQHEQKLIFLNSGAFRWAAEFIGKSRHFFHQEAAGQADLVYLGEAALSAVVALKILGDRDPAIDRFASEIVQAMGRPSGELDKSLARYYRFDRLHLVEVSPHTGPAGA